MPIQEVAQTFWADEAPADIDARMIAPLDMKVWFEVSTADNVQTTEVYTASSNAKVIGMVCRRAANTTVHSTYKNHINNKQCHPLTCHMDKYSINQPINQLI